MNKPLLAGLILLSLLIVGRIGIGFAVHPSDQDQIRDALRQSIEASKEGRPGGVMDLLSNHLTYNGQDASENLGQVAEFIKNQKPDFVVDDPTPTVNGDDAQITSPVTISLSLLGQSKSWRLNDVVLVFHKEPATRFLVIPSSKWRLVDVRSATPKGFDFTQ